MIMILFDLSHKIMLNINACFQSQMTWYLDLTKFTFW